MSDILAVQPTRRLATGALVILLGLGLYGMQYLDDMGESITLILLGGLCLAGYLNTRSRFLLVVGCLVTGLGVGSFGERTWSVVGEFTKIGLGIGFILIYLISLLWEKKSHWWSLIIVGIGILIVLGSFGQGHKSKGDGETRGKPAGPA